MRAVLGRVGAAILLASLSVLPATAQSAPFAVGQIWTVKDPAMPSLRVRIGRIDNLAGQVVVSVSMLDVPCPATAPCKTIGFGHIPFDQDALASAVGAVTADKSPAPENFAEGYATWKNANGGAFTISPSQVAAGIFASAPAR